MTDKDREKPRVTTKWPPGGLTGLLVRQVVKADADPKSPEARIALGMLEGWTSTVISVLLSGVKLLLGWLTGSIAVLADGVNNLADVGSSLVIALGFRWSQKPRDNQHPFGHGRIESVTALVLSTVLVMVGLDVASESIQRLVKPEAIRGGVTLIGILGATIVLKEWLARFARRLARVTESPVLEADSWNHHFDVLSTTVVVIALIGSRYGLSSIDGWAGLLVSIFIVYTGVKFARQSVSTLLGEAPTEEEVQTIEKAALAEAGVRGVHDIILHKYGDMRLASLHIEVDAGRSALEVHDLAERVEIVVGKSASCDVIVHVDPVDRNHARYAEVLAMLETFAKSESRVTGFHDLRVTGERGELVVSVDFVVHLDVSTLDYESVRTCVRAFLQQRVDGLKDVQVGVEGGYAGAVGMRIG